MLGITSFGKVAKIVAKFFILSEVARYFYKIKDIFQLLPCLENDRKYFRTAPLIVPIEFLFCLNNAILIIFNLEFSIFHIVKKNESL